MARPYDIRERSKLFARDVYEFGRMLGVLGRAQAHLAQQATRASGSIGANLAEAKDGETKADFISKNCIALKEAREVRSWLLLIRDAEPSFGKAAEPLIVEASELIAILTTIIKNARATKSRGERPPGRR